MDVPVPRGVIAERGETTNTFAESVASGDENECAFDEVFDYVGIRGE